MQRKYACEENITKLKCLKLNVMNIAHLLSDRLNLFLLKYSLLLQVMQIVPISTLFSRLRCGDLEKC